MRPKRTLHLFWQLTLVAALSGCATPQRVKDASAAQLQLISSLDAATKSLHDGLLGYAAADDDLIRQETRILVTRQAIYAALEKTDNRPKTFDQAFDDSNAKIRPYIDLTLQDPKQIQEDEQALDDEIKKLNDQLTMMADGVAKTTISIRRDNLLKRQNALKTRPTYVKAQLDAGASAMKNVDTLRALVDDDLAALRMQIAVMKEAATRVDTWLKIDVTPSQDQVDSLKSTFSDLIMLNQKAK
jgi:hypothetical protein